MAQQTVLHDDELARKAGAIRLLAKGVAIALGIGEIIFVVFWLLNPLFPILSLTLVFAATLSVSLISYWLVRAGKVKAAGYCFVLGLLLDSAIITPLFGGFAGPMAITYLFSILAAGMVISIRSSFFVAILATVLYLAMIGVEQAGLLPQLIKEGDRGALIPYLTAIMLLVFFYLVAFLSWFAASRLQRALEDVRHYATGLQAANEKLQASEEELRATNEELEASNEELRATEEELRASNEELRAANEELKDAQEHLVRSEKLAAIGQLAGGVGHELRNPLGAIKNAVYYIRGKLVNSELTQKEPRIMEFLGIVDDEINASNKIINDLLSFSQVGKPAVSPARIEAVISDAIKHTTIPENIQVDSKLDADLPQVEVDTDQLRQVLVNMFTNAVQAMTDGGRLTIGARKNDGFMEVEITDTGTGIPKENMRRLFDPLYTTKAKGIGLGLAVCKSIIDRHQGRIDVESAPGKGTTFSIKLPLNAK